MRSMEGLGGRLVATSLIAGALLLAMAVAPSPAAAGKWTNCKGKFTTHVTDNLKCGIARAQSKRAWSKIENTWKQKKTIRNKFKMGKWKCKNQPQFQELYTTTCKRARISGDTQVLRFWWSAGTLFAS